MKKLYCFIILILAGNLSKAQNLVPNGDFEIYIECPLWYNDLDSAWAWSNPMTNIPGVSGTPDYFHACANYPVGMPSNFQGYQAARSKFAYAGIYLKEGNGALANHREYIQTWLNTPLVAGTCYHFQMYVNLSNHCHYTTDDIGVRISNTFLSNINNQDPLLYLPSLNNISTNTFDSLNWTLVEGDYTAAGGELYLLIGNFKTDMQTSTVTYNSASPVEYIYCYIDDVSLKRCATTTVDINEKTGNETVHIYPNPALNYINVESKSAMTNASVHIYDIAGKEVYNGTFINESSNNITVEISTLHKGLYVLSVTTDTQHLVSRFVKD